MKLLIISQYYYPEQFLINDIAPELVRRGHKVTVICGIPNYPKGVFFEGYENRYEEMIDGVMVLRCKNVPRRKNPLSLFRNYISFYRNANKLVDSLTDSYDVVLSYQLSPITMAIPAIRYKKSTGTPLLLYCLDIWPESAQAHVVFKGGLLYRYISCLSRRIYNDCSRILVSSAPFIDYLIHKDCVPRHKLAYLPQHADDSMINENLSKDIDDGRVHFMYAGNFGAGQTLDVIVRAAEVLKSRSDFVIDMVGDGSKKDELVKLITKLGVEDIFVFHGNQKREDMPSFYKKADVLLITLRGNNAVGNTMPGKLQTYMTVGKPILGAINGAAQEVINEARCGRCVCAGDSVGLARLMASYLDNPLQYAVCGNNARDYFRAHFTLEHFINGLELELNKLVSK